MIGLSLSAGVAAVAVRRRAPGARLTLACLAVFIVMGALFPTWLVDLSYFLFAVGLVLPLLMAEVCGWAATIRSGRSR